MLGQRINELRIAHGWNQVQLAEKLNITKQTVSNWENDNIQPSIEMLIRIAKLFHVSTDYLLGLDGVTRINADGLPMEFIAHISQIIDDYKNK
ncbi:MAG: helix-turn-helix transcriptional regulator [Clostridia bacterium]|nr:helix-turn-helix transcriptional regulator [Clostridia bacterium]